MNYYAEINKCKCCGKPDDKIHIGKSSMGWTFSFATALETVIGSIKSYKDWKKLLKRKDVKIKDENGDSISFKTLHTIIMTKRKEENNHAREYPNGCFVDPEGHSFSEYEFC